MRSNTDLTVTVTDATGISRSFASNAPDPGDRPRAIQFGTQAASGFLTAGFNLNRAIDRENADLHLGDSITMYGADGNTAYEGYISALPRSLDSDTHTLSVQCVGWITHASDEPFSEVFIDRDTNAWTPSPRKRLVDLIASTPQYTQPEEPSVAHDATAGTAAMILRTAESWASPIRPIAEGWYDAGAAKVAKVHYDIVNVGAANTADANWSLLIRTTDTDDLSVINAATADLWPPPAPAYFTPAVTGRYAVVSFFFEATPGGAAGYVYSVHVRNIAVYGDHGLTLVGTNPQGVTASDVIKHSIGRYCPLLNTAGVQATTYPISQLVWKGNAYDLWLKVNSYHLWEIAVWENRTVYFRPVDLTTWDWEIRHNEMGNTIGLQGDEITDLRNGIIVEYVDVVTGVAQTLHPDNHAELRDEAIDNPANEHGRRMFGEPFSIPYPTTQGNALELGRLRMIEDNQVKAPGSFTLQGHVRDRAGDWQPAWKVRTGHKVRLTSSANLSDRPRLVVETSYDHSARSVTVGVDSTLRYIEAIFDRTTTALAAAGRG